MMIFNEQWTSAEGRGGREGEGVAFHLFGYVEYTGVFITNADLTWVSIK